MRTSRCSQASNSGPDTALSKEKSGRRWRTGENRSETGAPTRWVGESRVTRSGCSVSQAYQFPPTLVVAGVVYERVVQDVVVVVVSADFGP